MSGLPPHPLPQLLEPVHDDEETCLHAPPGLRVEALSNDEPVSVGMEVPALDRLVLRRILHLHRPGAPGKETEVRQREIAVP